MRKNKKLLVLSIIVVVFFCYLLYYICKSGRHTTHEKYMDVHQVEYDKPPIEEELEE